MTRIRRLALAAVAFCLAVGPARAHGPPLPFDGYYGDWEMLVFSGLFLFGVMAAASGLFRLAVWSVRWQCCKGTGFITRRMRTSQPWRITVFVVRLVLFLVLMIPIVIAVYIGSLVITFFCLAEVLDRLDFLRYLEF